MKVALVTNRFPILSETFVHNHAVGLHDAGVDVTVVATSPADDPYRVDDAPMYIEGRRFEGPVRSVVVSRGLATTARQIASHLAGASARDLALWSAARRAFGSSRRALRAWLFALPLSGFDILHFEFSGLAVNYIDAIEILAPARVVVSCRGTAERITPLFSPDRAARLGELFAKVSRVHCVSNDMLRTCASYGLDPAKAFVNHPAIDAKQFTAPSKSRAPKHRLQLLSTGRLIWAKGLEYALLAIRDLVARGLDVAYQIIGTGPEEERLRFAIHDLRLEPYVTMAGRKPPAEVRRALELADIFLLPSVSEGISNAALEAMAMALPVVSTTAGGMAEAIEQGVSGILVPSRDPRAMADAIVTLAESPALRERLGANARIRIENAFTLERQIRTYLQEYAALGVP